MSKLDDMEQAVFWQIERLHDDVKRAVEERNLLLENQKKYPLLHEGGVLSFHDVEWGNNGVQELEKCYQNLRTLAEKLNQYHEELRWITAIREELK